MLSSGCTVQLAPIDNDCAPLRNAYVEAERAVSPAPERLVELRTRSERRPDLDSPGSRPGRAGCCVDVRK
jgi:hypothetical protein